MTLELQALLTNRDVEAPAVVNPFTLTGDGKTATPLDFSADTKNMFNFFDGTTMHEVEGTITSDGDTVTATVEAIGGGDVEYKSADEIKTLASTPAASVVLTPGTDTAPTLNYIFIDEPTNTFQANTTGFPATLHVPLAISLIGSAAFTALDGTYKTHQWTDALHKIGDNGHLSHINRWIRSQHATWISGSALSHSGSGTTTVNTSISSGVMLQLHQQSTPAITSPADMFIVNHETTPFTKISNLAAITTDSAGVSINNKYTPLVVWYAFSAITGDSKIFINKPAGSYNSEADARADNDKLTNFSIPAEFIGTAFLVSRMIVRNSGGTLTVFDGAGDSLLGTLPNTAAGSSTTVSATFLDTTFAIQNVTDVTKEIVFDASEITTGTTRTITMADNDVDLGDMASLAGSVYTGDVEISDTLKGVILTSPDLARWRITIDNAGALITTKLA